MVSLFFGTARLNAAIFRSFNGHPQETNPAVSKVRSMTTSFFNMADDVCGPSSALRNLQKHSAADRTLQQDRISTAQNHPRQVWMGILIERARRGSSPSSVHTDTAGGR